MYLDYFGLSKLPFTISPDPEFLFPSVGHQEALAHLQYSLTGHGGLIALTGEVGAGKTTLCRAFIDALPDNIHLAYIFNPQLSPIELLQTICDELHIEYQSDDSLKQLYQRLNQSILEWYSQGERVICLIDEAQVMSPVVLEQVRLLTNLETNKEKLINLVLVGQPELRDLLAQHQLRQLNQRITARYHLNLLTKQECRDYLAHRVAQAGSPSQLFVQSASDQIWQAAHGIPRLINAVADRALLGAFASSSVQVSVKIARQAIAEVIGQEARSQPISAESKSWTPADLAQPRWIKPALLMSSVAVGTFSFLLWQAQTESKPLNRVTQSVSSMVSSVAGKRSDENTMPVPSQVGAGDTSSVNQAASLATIPREDDLTASAVSGANPLSLLTRSINLPDVNCGQLIAYNYRCVRLAWSLAELRKLEHPVAVETATGRWQLLANAQQQPVSSAMVLWQPPQGYVSAVRPGDRSDVITWVRQKLDVSWSSKWNTIGPTGQNVRIDNTFYDPILAIAVEEFQKRNRLTPDRTIGPKTILYLQRDDS